MILEAKDFLAWNLKMQKFIIGTNLVLTSLVHNLVLHGNDFWCIFWKYPSNKFVSEMVINFVPLNILVTRRWLFLKSITSSDDIL